MIKISKIKEDAKFYDNFGNLIETCKTVALSEFHSLEKKIRTFERFVEIIESFFKLIGTRYSQHPFINPQEKPRGIIMITSDAGLSGGLDMNIAVTAINELKTDKDQLIIIGRQGHNYAQENNISFISFPGIEDNRRFDQAMELRDHIVEEVLKGRLGPIKVIYARPLSLIIQRVETLNLLPKGLSQSPPKTASDITIESTPENLKTLNMLPKGLPRSLFRIAPDIIMESTPENLIEYLISLWLGQKFFDVFGLSRLAEVAARFMHAEDSSQKIKKITKELRLKYLRARHEIVDQQMRELFAARVSR
jgi:ATP synthase F1 gamma subunit